MTRFSIPPLEELRENLREAAHREGAVAPEPGARRRRRRPPKAMLALAGALVLGAGAATAADLISVGKPAADNPQRSSSNRSAGPLGPVVVRAADPDRPLPWGVSVFTAKDGDDCAIAGQLRGDRLGLIQNGTFRPYEDRTGGGCGRLDSLRFFADIRVIDGRSLVYGRAAPKIRSLRLTRGKEVRTARPAANGGAFLFVFDGRVRPNELELTAE